jgi:hypothetical protein
MLAQQVQAEELPNEEIEEVTVNKISSLQVELMEVS